MALLDFNADHNPYDPPPATAPNGYVAWRYIKKPMEPGSDRRWEPAGWELIFPDHVLEVDYMTHLCTRASSLYAPVT